MVSNALSSWALLMLCLFSPDSEYHFDSMNAGLESPVQFVVHHAKDRGHADHGWLNTHHSFSFAGWHDPAKMHFGAMRVLNDDVVSGGGGFGMHPHDNMEIVSIPTQGALEHKDSMGNSSVIRTGDVQIMSAGTGVRHSEFNHSASEEVAFFQIWIYPSEQGLEPRYDQEPYEPNSNGLTCIVSPDGAEGVRIHQRSWLYTGQLEAGEKLSQPLHGAGQGLYVMVLDGAVTIEGQLLERRDAMGIWDAESVELDANSSCSLLLIEVPMQW